MPVVPLQCPRCAGVLQIDSAWGGQHIACPHCQGPIALPPEAILLGLASGPAFGGETHPPPQEATVALHCPACFGPFQVPLAATGKQVGCPHCGSYVVVPPLGSGQPAPSVETKPEQVQPTPPVRTARVDELLPPGAAIAPPQAVSKPVTAQVHAPPKQDDRFPPAMSPRQSPVPPAPASRAERDAADLLPPSRKPAIDERLPPGAESAPRPEAPAPQAPQPQPTRPKRDVTDLLPPAAPEAAVEARAEHLLPPGAGTAPAAPTARPHRADQAAALLPPGAAAAPSATAGEAEVAVPTAPMRLPAGPASQPADALLVAVKDAPKVIGSGDDEVEVRRLSPEERSRRRFRKGLILWTICLLVLIAVFYFFTR